MRVDSPSLPLAELLRESGWTRRLARGLTGNDAAADDVLQDTWLAALRHPPDTRQPLRSWLGTVVRNHVFNQTRERVRRQLREAHADGHERPATAEDLLGGSQIHRILVELVEQLPPSYRRIVLLAYFDGLSSAAIATRENVPASTVRGRLRTALDLLREGLDGRLGGRRAWMLPALEFTRRAPGAAQKMSGPASTHTAAAVRHAGGATSTTPGVGVYSFSGPLAWVSLAGSLTAAVLVWRGTRDPAPHTEDDGSAASGWAQAAEATPASPTDQDNRVDRAPPPAEPFGAAAPVERPRLVRAPRRAVTASDVRQLPNLAATSPRPVLPFQFLGPRPVPASACRLITRTEGPIAEACARGGRPAAKKAMKVLIREATRAGRKYTCPDCHRDLDSYILFPNAQSDFDEMLVKAALSSKAL